MFIWFIAIAALAFTWINPGGVLRLGTPGGPYNTYWRKGGDYARIWAGIGVAAVLFASVIATAVTQWQSSDIANSRHVIEARTEQRDELLSAFDEVLDSSEFTQLMEAAVPEDVLFLKNHPEVSGFLLGRADRIVEVNRTLYAEQNRLLNQARGVCNMTQNPFIPQIPLLGPDCALGSLEASFDS